MAGFQFNQNYCRILILIQETIIQSDPCNLISMSTVYAPIEERLVEERVTQELMRLKPIQHQEEDYMLALHEKTQNELSIIQRRPEYQNPIFNHLSKQEQSNSECKKCSSHLSWGSGKVLCRFCGWWVCNQCIAKQRFDPQNTESKAKICQICEELYLKNTVMHDYYMKQNVLQAVFKRLVNEQYQLERLIEEEIRKTSDNDKKAIANNAMSRIIAVNEQKVQNDGLKEEVETLRYKLQNAEKMYSQLVLKCQAKKRKFLKKESGVSFASEMSRVQMADDDMVEPPTAIEGDRKSEKTERSESFMNNILDEYNNPKSKSAKEEDEGRNGRQACTCQLF